MLFYKWDFVSLTLSIFSHLDCLDRQPSNNKKNLQYVWMEKKCRTYVHQFWPHDTLSWTFAKCLYYGFWLIEWAFFRQFDLFFASDESFFWENGVWCSLSFDCILRRRNFHSTQYFRMYLHLPNPINFILLKPHLIIYRISLA